MSSQGKPSQGKPNQGKLPDHLIALPGDAGSRWAMWRTVCVRGAGFPAKGVLRIADAECAAAADRLAALDNEAEEKREAALAALRGELEGAAKEQLDVLVKALRKVKRSQAPATEGLAAATVEAIGAWREAAGRAEAERPGYQAAFAAAEERLDQALREVAGGDRFREAVTWQNRHAAQTGLASFLRRPAGAGKTSARDRGHAQMLASYLQRYSVKNDSIGFFGPVGWAELGTGDEVITARPGKDLLAARQVYFEGWAIDAIADRLAEDAAMRPWLAPRRSPFLRREGNTWVAPNGQKMELGPLSGALMAACDGTRSARDLMRGVAAALGGTLPPDKEATLWGILADFHTQGAVRWGFQIPLSLTPERTLRELLLAVEDEPLRERALAVLDEFIEKGAAVSRAAGDPGELGKALGDLEAAFVRLSGQSSVTRGEGQLYAGRTLVYEDCRRDLELTLGAPFLADLAPALSLVLDGARWHTHFVGEDHRATFREIHAELSAQAGSPQIDFLTFTRAALPRLVSGATQERLRQELYARWGRVLAIPPGERRVSYRSEDLRPLVDREFAAPGAGWQKAHLHSPDLMIAAASVEAIRQGDYQAVLGEVHVAVNSLDRGVFVSQHPHPEELLAFIESDLPEPSLIPVFAKAWNQTAAAAGLGLWAPAVTGRMDVMLRSAKDFYLDYSLDPPGVPAGQLLPIAELIVEPAGDSLAVQPRDGRVSFDVADFYQLVMMMQVLATFRVLPTGTYTPRVTIDRLVVARESWIIPAAELAFVAASTPAERFAGARRWAGRRELPRFVFVKVPNEAKPFYLDLESPVLVEGFAKAVRTSTEGVEDAEIHLSEMLPDHSQSWLPDAEGNRYTCELRTVALDLT